MDKFESSLVIKSVPLSDSILNSQMPQQNQNLNLTKYAKIEYFFQFQYHFLNTIFNVKIILFTSK